MVSEHFFLFFVLSFNMLDAQSLFVLSMVVEGLHSEVLITLNILKIIKILRILMKMFNMHENVGTGSVLVYVLGSGVRTAGLHDALCEISWGSSYLVIKVIAWQLK